MRDGDLYAFLRIDLAIAPAHTSTPVYFRTADLRAAVGQAKESYRKSTSEGSELTLTWPSWVPARSGNFVGVNAKGRLVCRWDDGRTSSYWQWQKWLGRHLYLEPGDPILTAETMVAGIVAPPGDIPCARGWDLRTALSDADTEERYAAVKAAGVLHRLDLYHELEQIARDETDWRLRLEATGSLARLDFGWVDSVVKIALTPTHSDEHRIESVFVLSEIPADEAALALAKIAEPQGTKPRELRAAAVWGVARGAQPRPDLALRYAADEDDLVALHAIAGLSSLPDDLIPSLVDWLAEDDRQAATAAKLLLRHQCVQPLLEAVHRGDRARLWALRALGELPPELVRDEGRGLLTPAIELDLEPMWIAHYDWLRGEWAEGLDALDVQKVRFNPPVEP